MTDDAKRIGIDGTIGISCPGAVGIEGRSGVTPDTDTAWRVVKRSHPYKDGTNHRWAVEYTSYRIGAEGVTVEIADWLTEETALLIAAAPDLLAALQSIMSNVSPGGFDGLRRLNDGQICRIRDLARAAIAKATAP